MSMIIVDKFSQIIYMLTKDFCPHEHEKKLSGAVGSAL
jgi:hypothetical protein